MSKTSTAWNGGQYTGTRQTTPRPRRWDPVVDTCSLQECGTPGSGPSPRPDMVRVPGAGEDGAAAWYCPGRCTSIARARTDLRTGGHDEAVNHGEL
ncbi:hypothetical protein [Streptomyces aureocirculatus]|uniref:hypothetical protein n=1 Tax=Streptomyces aureocirculatus TaxID=67275 RepID=UPI0004C9584C|nr:hypothetical protein [Streptomyces aureocirculatus]